MTVLNIHTLIQPNYIHMNGKLCTYSNIALWHYYATVREKHHYVIIAWADVGTTVIFSACFKSFVTKYNTVCTLKAVPV